MTAIGIFPFLTAGLLLLAASTEGGLADCSTYPQSNFFCLPMCSSKSQGVGCQDCKSGSAKEGGILTTCYAIINSNCSTGECKDCIRVKGDILNCTIGRDDFSSCFEGVHVEVISSSSFTVNEGSDLTLTCNHILPVRPTSFTWYKGSVREEDINSSDYQLSKLSKRDETVYSCSVKSDCGVFFSKKQQLHVQGKDSSVVIIIVCGVAALVFILLLALGMKLLLRKEISHNKTRREQNGSTTVTDMSW
ncbi:hypothetical protein MATL_G00173500 [Megalops atlanticus]|uniref:Ig-like domain-containing protein n=1 Tax=Megalops atlanticus TaxID=7932 RepID=A0A9D3PP80_MEGAT|nr:hypothetical protein MATL_G00173500 [Megalops atlanticus]